MQAVERFVVGRKDVGEVAFIDAVDLRGMVLDAVVDMDKGRIQVYGLPGGAPRPAAGQGLNRPALLTFRYLPTRVCLKIYCDSNQGFNAARAYLVPL